VRSWKLLLEYDGGRYSGWQEQKNARTVAGELRKAAEEFLRAEVEIGGAGRTDAGVHALGQVAHLRAALSRKPPAEMLRRELNERLPADIAVLEAAEVSGRFHARHDALSRTYLYRISQRKRAFEKRYVWWVKAPLDVRAMAAAAQTLPGRHDFRCFCDVDPAGAERSTVVVVESARIEMEDELILFRIEASHFLWKMVRRITGALVKLGLGEIATSDFETLLAGRAEPRLNVAAWTAPSSGLFLESVRYPGELFPRRTASQLFSLHL
jgi:tRNA pseudouridine38-40 synthase